MVRKLPISLLKGSADSSDSSTHRNDQSSASSLTATNRQQNTGHHAAASSHILVEDESTGVPPIGTHHKGSFHVYMTHKILKLREIQQQPHSEMVKSSIFKSCIMFINGYTNPPIEELRRLIHQHGGETIAYRAIRITHFVCNNFTDAQLKAEYSKIRLNVQNRVHNVTSAWILDSIKQMKRLDENHYSPQGLSFQHGRDISTMLSSSNNANRKMQHSSGDRISSSTNHIIELDVMDTSTQRSDAQSSDSPVAYTSSQEAFVTAIPIEMRAEVAAQLKEINKRKAIDSSIVHADKHMRHAVGSSIRDGIAFRDEDEDNPTLRSDTDDRSIHRGHCRSSSSGMVNHHLSSSSSRMVNNHPSSSSGMVNNHPSSSSTGMVNNHPSSSSSGMVNNHPSSSSSGVINNHRKNNLESMIACIHFSDDRYNSSKSIGAKIRQYVDTLLSLDSCSSSSSNSIDMDDSSQHLVKSNSAPSTVVVALLEDYAKWLILSDQLEQVR